MLLGIKKERKVVVEGPKNEVPRSEDPGNMMRSYWQYRDEFKGSKSKEEDQS